MSCSIYKKVADAAKEYGIEVHPDDIQAADELSHGAVDTVSMKVYLAVMAVAENFSDLAVKACANSIRSKLLEREHAFFERME